LDPTLGREISRALVAGAVKKQEEIRETRFHGSKRKISILGGRGKMGQWFARYLYSRGHQVLIHDPAGPLHGFHFTKSFEKAVREAEILLLSVPLHAARRVYRRVRRLKPSCTITDVFSLKTPVLDEISHGLSEGLSITSIHPLFGPEVYLLSERTLLLCGCGNGAADQVMEDLFVGTSLDLVRIEVKEHDRAMGIVLGLSHALNIIFSEALVRSHIPATGLRHVATTTFEKQLKTASEVARENARLYYDIQHMNRHSPEVYKLLQRAFDKFRAAAQSESSRLFVSLMKRGRAFYEEA
jgi:chorismate mutase/prephenate dehydrogenase